MSVQPQPGGLAYAGPASWADADCDVNIWVKEGSITENVARAKPKSDMATILSCGERVPSEVITRPFVVLVI